MTQTSRPLWHRIALETLGWLLVAGGIAALILPGPGLLMLFAGLVILSQSYEWAEKRLDPVERAAMRAAAEGVATWPRIVMSTLGALSIIAVRGRLGDRDRRPGLVAVPRLVVAPRRLGVGLVADPVRVHRAGAADLQRPPVPDQGREAAPGLERVPPVLLGWTG